MGTVPKCIVFEENREGYCVFWKKVVSLQAEI